MPLDPAGDFHLLDLFQNYSPLAPKTQRSPLHAVCDWSNVCRNVFHVDYAPPWIRHPLHIISGPSSRQLHYNWSAITAVLSRFQTNQGRVANAIPWTARRSVRPKLD